jgi:hypothetical protein
LISVESIGEEVPLWEQRSQNRFETRKPPDQFYRFELLKGTQRLSGIIEIPPIHENVVTE